METLPRVAVCISGQPRSAIQTFPLIMTNIIQANNADVFIHMNYDAETPYMEKSHADNGQCQLPAGIDTWVIDNYKPVKYLVEKPRDYKNSLIGMADSRLANHKRMNQHKNWTDEQHRDYIVRQMYNMYYSIYKANELKELYALENGIRYDYVFRVRFDITPREPIIARNYDPNFIYYLDIGQTDELIADWCNWGSNTVMNVYASLFLHLEYLNTFRYMTQEERQENKLEKSNIYGGIYEHSLRDLMYLHKIPKCGIRTNCGLLVVGR